MSKRRRKPGRKPLFSTPSVTIKAVVSGAQRQYLKRLGGRRGVSYAMRTVIDEHMAAAKHNEEEK